MLAASLSLNSALCRLLLYIRFDQLCRQQQVSNASIYPHYRDQFSRRLGSTNPSLFLMLEHPPWVLLCWIPSYSNTHGWYSCLCFAFGLCFLFALFLYRVSSGSYIIMLSSLSDFILCSQIIKSAVLLSSKGGALDTRTVIATQILPLLTQPALLTSTA